MRQGNWRFDKRDGQGKSVFVSKLTYDGEWKDDKTNGFGVCHYPDGSRYEGEWQNDMMHGRGTFEYASGAKYEGEFAANKYDGYGTFLFSNGAKYEGQFKDNQFHGTGTFTDAQKTTWKGKVRRPAARLPVSKRAVLASIHGFDSRARLPLRAVLQRNGSWLDARLRRRALERLCWLFDAGFFGRSPRSGAVATQAACARFCGVVGRRKKLPWFLRRGLALFCGG